MNRVILIGRLARDPEIRYTQSGKAFCRFTVAVDRRFSRAAQQEGQQTADFIPVTCWEKLAEICGNNLTKGRRIGVEEVACRQSMGQKNTALTLWLCITFMHPLVAPGIAGYIAWQNFFLTYYMNRRSRLKG